MVPAGISHPLLPAHLSEPLHFSGVVLEEPGTCVASTGAVFQLFSLGGLCGRYSRICMCGQDLAWACMAVTTLVTDINVMPLWHWDVAQINRVHPVRGRLGRPKMM